MLNALFRNGYGVLSSRLAANIFLKEASLIGWQYRLFTSSSSQDDIFFDIPLC
jgi:hypothetical protein